ncbi:hypothetical protein EKO04_008159 [Ascochyta lentis]|uniref:glucan 1,3-beta-glucosidase n=1 Tax=Ascochyta lentis TaxID=205686 RepID=A0A8H7IZ76_9PLEO|nr:hypothetical protein EKO04_008159 [Ascochyta lentis]
MVQKLFTAALIVGLAIGLPQSNGVNLGSWLEKERVHDPIWWVNVGGENASDEWTLCQTLGKQCGPIFEARYGSFLNFSTIDTLASVGVNTLRIPTIYAAWVKVPGSELYSGNQVQFLDRIVSYAACTDNVVMDTHVYYFAAAGTYANYVNGAVCGQAQYIANQTKFPNFIGEWSLQTMFNNTIAGRKSIFNTERYAWSEYLSGGAFWTAVSYSITPVDGEGVQREYWSYVDLINQGVAKTPVPGQTFC